MPQIGKMKFPYTPSGIKQAKQAMSRKQKIASQIGQDKVYRPDRDGPKGPMDQVTAPGTPDKLDTRPRPKPMRDQAFYRPGGIAGIRFPGRPLPRPGKPRPGKGRGPLPIGSKRPGRGPLGIAWRPGARPGKPVRPGRGAIAPRPWRPKPPNRKYL